MRKDGQTVATIQRGAADGYDHRSYTFAPDGQSIISGGSNGFFHAFDLTGKKIGDFIGHEGVVWAVATSPDGRYLVSGGGDQTIRLWNLQTRELIVNLYTGIDGEWVMWTPQGYYMGSPGSDKIVGWQINKGADNAADYVGADQLRTHLNRPDIVEKAIILASAERAIRDSHGTTFKLADLLGRPVPKFRIVSPAAGTSLRTGRAEVKIDVEAVRDPDQGDPRAGEWPPGRRDHARDGQRRIQRRPAHAGRAARQRPQRHPHHAQQRHRRQGRDAPR